MKDRGKIDGETVTNLCPLFESQSMALRWRLARKWGISQAFPLFACD